MSKPSIKTPCNQTSRKWWLKSIAYKLKTIRLRNNSSISEILNFISNNKQKRPTLKRKYSNKPKNNYKLSK